MNYSKIKTIVIHVFFWIMFFLLPFILRPDFSDRPKNSVPFSTAALILYLFVFLSIVVLFYLNAHYVFERTIKKKHFVKLAIYQLSIALLILLSFNFFLSLSRSVELKGAPAVFPIMIYTITTIISLTYYLFNDKARLEKEQAEREREFLKAELQFLRWQISPHFLFNVLNNMAALARLESQQLEPIIIKLSNLMRYMLYDSEGKRNSLENELDYIRNYISLQTLRFGDKINIGLMTDIDDTILFEIEPMLLIPFVENAFKHGTSGIVDPLIKVTVSLKRSANGTSLFLFEVKNKYNENESTEETLGIGLSNVKRRINLLYGKNAGIVIDQSNNIYKIILNIVNQ